MTGSQTNWPERYLFVFSTRQASEIRRYPGEILLRTDSSKVLSKRDFRKTFALEIRRLRISFRCSPEGSTSYGTETLPSFTGDRSTGRRRVHAAPTAFGSDEPLLQGSNGDPVAAELAAQSSTHSGGLRTSEAISPYPSCFALEPGRSTDSGAIGNDPSFLSY